MGGGREAFTLTMHDDAKSIRRPIEIADAFPEMIQSKLRSKLGCHLQSAVLECERAARGILPAPTAGASVST
eukprot:4254444-Pyramimonas_sp.AAC.1